MPRHHASVERDEAPRLLYARQAASLPDRKACAHPLQSLGLAEIEATLCQLRGRVEAIPCDDRAARLHVRVGAADR
eukprot:5775147-Prymnesium_polylepis.4